MIKEDDDDWTDDIEEILSKVRQNCIDMYKYHLCRYFQYKRVLPIFRVPVLILNALNSVFSVGLQPYMEQSLISVLNCMISLIATLINSIEMYMGIQKSMESEMSSSQGFYILSIGIYKMLTLKRANRDINGKQYLMECYNTYSELVRNSKLIKDPYMLQKDFLQNVDKSMGVITNIDIPLDESLQDLAAKTMGEVSTPKLKIPLDVETGGPPSQIIQRFSVNAAVNSLEDISSGHYSQHQPPHQSHYPHQPHNQHHPHSYSYHHNQHHQQPQQPRRPSFTNEYDPLYSLSRKSIFGGAPKKSSFLEMAGVDLREPTIEPNTASSHHSYHLTATEENPPIIDSIKSIFSNMAIHSRPASHNNTPDNSHHTHTHSHSDEDQIKPHFEEMITKPVFPRNISQINLIQEKEQISQSPPQSQTSGLLMPPAKQQKEKGVKDIIQEIENKPKKDISTNPHDP